MGEKMGMVWGKKIGIGRKIVGVVLMITMLLVALFVMTGAAKASRDFNSEEQMRQYFFDSYFFDFSLNEIEFAMGIAHSDDSTRIRGGCVWKPNPNITFNTLIISYTYESDFLNMQRRASLSVQVDIGRNVHNNILINRFGYVRAVTIDSFEGYIVVARLEFLPTRVSFMFEIENTSYAISTEISDIDNDLYKFIDYFLSIITPAIESRQKYQ